MKCVLETKNSKYNLYKLVVDDQLYFVPLWLEESCFDASGHEIIVLCEPELPDHVAFDDDSNLIVRVEVPFDGHLLQQTMIPVKATEKHVYNVPVQDLQIKASQTYRIRHQGISRTFETEEKRNRSDVFVKIHFI